MDITLRQLECLVAVADHRSMSAAADFLDVSQPSVSHQLQQLEDALGYRLLNRHARGVSIRPEGQIVVDRARKILQEVESIGLGLEEAGTMRGSVRMGIVPSASSHHFPLLYRELKSRYPLVSVEIWEEFSEELVKGVRHGDLDLAVVTLPLAYSDIVVDPLWREELVLIVPSHADWGTEPVPMERLADQPYIGLTHGNGLQTRVLELFHRAGIQPRMIFEAKSIPTVIGFVAAGHGVSIVPVEAVRAQTGTGAVKAYPLAPPAYRQLVLVHRPLSLLSAPAKALVKFFMFSAKRIA